MSGSETGLIASREAYGVGLQKSPFPSQPTIQNMLLGFNPDGTAVYKTAPPTPTQASPSYNHNSASDGPTGCGGQAGSQHGCGVDMNMSGEPTKRKRGRPRKYAPDGNMALALSHVSVAVAGGSMSSPPPLHVSGSAAPPSQSGGPASPSSFKKARGRPPGSKQKQKIEGSTGLGFTPHVITVKAGEDVSSKIMSFSQHGPRAVCILSANGAVSNVTLRQPASSGGTVTYEGRFEILSLSGSFLLLDSGGQRSRTGGLSVSLAGPDGRVLGGCVAGLLTAAAPVQVVVGSFISESCKESKGAPNHNHGGELLSATPKSCAPAAASSPPSHATFSESSGGNSPAPHQVNHQSLASYNNNNNNPNGMLNMPWN